MNILPLVIAPNELLKKISNKIEKIDDEVKKLADNMITTMYHEGGIGLAAVQVGILKKLIVMDTTYETDQGHHHDHSNCSGIHIKNQNPKIFINAEIIENSKEESEFKEGCLSFPGARSNVKRPQSIKVKYLDLNGNEIIADFHGIEAICIQHEIDHTNGITFVDRISKVKRDLIMQKMKKKNI